MIRFRVLGSVELTGPGGEEVVSVLAQPKRMALLAFLALATPRGFHRRDKIVGLFWPDSDHKRARASLRRSVHSLRKSLGEGAIVGRGDGEIGLGSGAVWTDVGAFQESLENGALEEALTLYRGDALEGFFLSGCPAFERWLDGERDLLRREAARGAWALAHQYISRGQWTDAERTGQQALELIPTDENEVRGFMEALARAGDRAAAVRLYERFAGVLSEELDLEPSPETRVVLETLRAQNEILGTRAPATAPKAHQNDGDPTSAPAGRNTSHAGSVKRHGTRWAFASLAGAVLVYLVLSRFLGVPDLFSPREGGSHSFALEGDDRPGIGVLLCENRSPDPEDEYFAGGVHDEILRSLSTITEIRTIGRGSLESYDDDPRPIGQLAQDLGVEFLGLCSVLIDRSQNQIRLNFTLLDGRTETQIWANAYAEDLSRRGILDLQEDLATQVARGVGARISPMDQLRLTAPPTMDDDAYSHYLRGVFERNSGTTESMFRAIRHLRLAVALDPGFAQAHSSLAGALAWISLYSPSVDHDSMVADGEAAARQALLADPNSAPAHAMVGLFRWIAGHDAEGAEAAFQRAIEIDPFCYEALLNLGMLLSHLGRDQEAIESVKRGLAADPLAAGANWNLAFRYYWAGQHEDAIRQIDHTLELARENPLVWLTSAFILSQAGLHGRAERALEGWGSRAGLHPDTTARIGALSTAFQKTGRQNPGAADQQLFDDLPFYWSYRLAAFLGDLPTALRILGEAEQDLWVHLNSLQADPLWNPFRAEPRFQALLETYGIRGTTESSI